MIHGSYIEQLLVRHGHLCVLSELNIYEHAQMNYIANFTRAISATILYNVQITWIESRPLNWRFCEDAKVLIPNKTLISHNLPN